MDVTSISAERAQEILDSSITEGYVNDAGHLVLKNGLGAEHDAGPISMLGAYPVGSLFFTESASNPAALLGGGTWSRWGVGKMPISLNPDDPDFDSVGESGGSKTHQLTVAEMPSHNHGGITTDDGLHNHTYPSNNAVGGIQAGGSSTVADDAHTLDNTGNAGVHHHGIPAQGGDTPFSIMNPYMVINIWKRTA